MSTQPSGRFVVTAPFRSVCDDYARALIKEDWLRLYAVGTRKLTPGIPRGVTKLYPIIGLASYLAGRVLPVFYWESFRQGLNPLFDRLVKANLREGDHILSSYGYANESFRWVKKNGGHTFLEAGNSHPENYWTIITEEHERWDCPYPPYSRGHHRRCLETLPLVDFVLAPSRYVANSFLQRGFSEEQILRTTFPIDLSNFYPKAGNRPKDKPLTIVSSGTLSLRKGTPYLLEAVRIVKKSVPLVRLKLISAYSDSIKPVLEKYGDLTIDWAPHLSHQQLGPWLQEGDMFVLPSLEEGLARSTLEAMACGLPTIVTNHTGSNDYIREGINGSVVPIRDAKALAESILSWAEKIQSSSWQPPVGDRNFLTVENFERIFLEGLQKVGIE